MKKILVLSAHPPLYKSKEAGQKVFYDYLRNLNQIYDIYLVTFIKKEEYSWGFEEGAELCKEVITIETNIATKIKSILLNPFKPLLLSARIDNQFKDSVKALISKHNFDAVHFEWEQMIAFYPLIQKMKIKTITCHDVISQMYSRKALYSKPLKLFYQYQERLVKDIERETLTEMTTVFTLNQKDSELLEKVNNKIITKELKPYFHKEDFTACEENKNYDLVFFGAMNRIENEKAVNWFLHDIYPKLKSKRKNINLLVVGNKPSDKLKIFCEKDKSITLTGFVEDPYQLIRESKVGIVPLKLGAGIKIKTLEFMASSIPVVSTTVGAEGINADESQGLFIKDEPKEFEETILWLLTNPELAESYGYKARSFIGQYYKFEENYNVLSETYNV
ncbi:glycosyltransferase [Priestia aryabhattai]